MYIEKNYRENDALRKSFNNLAEQIFGLTFENWYQNGFWKDDYIPYSVIVDGKVVANVSVNVCNMNYKGNIVNLIQLGTIMTDPDYRGNGFARALMEEVIQDYKGKTDGIFLFANDSVLGFYPKFGFQKAKEYQYTKKVVQTGECKAVNVPMKNRTDYKKMVEILAGRSQNSQMYMVGNTGLYMFYLSQFMTENVFYIADYDSYIIAELEDDTLIIHAIIGDEKIDEVALAFGSEVKNVVLCFTPNDVQGYEKSELHKKDSTFFVQGRFFMESVGDEYMIPTIAHA